MNLLARCTYWLRHEFIETGTGIHVWRWRALTLWIILFSVLVFLGLRHLREQTNDIRASREFAVRVQCEDQNDRNTKTIAELNRRIKAIKDPAQRQRAEQSKQFSVALIDTLAPVRNCKKVVALLTKTP